MTKVRVDLARDRRVLEERNQPAWTAAVGQGTRLPLAQKRNDQPTARLFVSAPMSLSVSVLM
jgi:hypothetical protein